MRDVVICEPLRTPIGRYGGTLRDCSAVDLGETVLRELLSRTRIDPGTIKKIIPYAQELKHSDTYPAEIVAGMRGREPGSPSTQFPAPTR